MKKFLLTILFLAGIYFQTDAKCVPSATVTIFHLGIPTSYNPILQGNGSYNYKIYPGDSVRLYAHVSDFCQSEYSWLDNGDTISHSGMCTVYDAGYYTSVLYPDGSPLWLRIDISYYAVGVDEINLQASLNLFPNPFSEKINITTEEIGTMEIILYDILSRKLLQQTFTNSTTINTTQLAKGIYIYELRNKDGVIKKGKVVKD